MSKVAEQQSAFQGPVENVLEQVDSALAVLAVTGDGHLVARAERKDIPSKRMAAMGSSLMSLGNTITRELSMGSCRNVISENEEGVVVFMQITPKTVLVSVASDNAALGMLLSASRRCIDKINENLKSQ